MRHIAREYTTGEKKNVIYLYEKKERLWTRHL